ncbi:gp436 family protein [Dickeya zeae]|uniref:gp436 family protein n=1 Tax=Dickeya zeae TaxID=204042 RepID=UPI0003A4D656|nr:phage protein Gp36 family protein [Dickeya zeae]
MYAQTADMVLAFGERECVSLTDRAFTGEIDDEVLTGALTRASAEIDSYLAGRYPVPWNDTPRILVGRCCDIARYLLCGSSTQMTDEIRERYSDAIRYFERVADGRITLGRSPSGDVVQPSGTSTTFTSAGRRFGRDSTQGGAF